MSRELRQTIFHVITGSLFFNGFLWVASLPFYQDKSIFLGLMGGMVLTDIMFLWLAAQMIYLANHPKKPGGSRRVVLGSFLRKALFGGILLYVLFVIPHVVNPLAMVIGGLGLKVGIYTKDIWTSVGKVV